jgi:hypothetical protein
LRTASISKIEKVGASARTAIAVAEKERRAPLIQRTTARMLRWGTAVQPM